MKRLRLAHAGNPLLPALEIFAIAWIMSGISGGLLSEGRIAVLRYYTVDSNILMGVAALLSALDELRVLRGKKAGLSPSLLVLKLTGTVSVTLTMLVTIFFLGPTLGRIYGFFSLFTNSSFFLHLFNPLLAIAVWVFCEKQPALRRSAVWLSLIPTVLYIIFYITVTLQHMQNGVIAPGYDWYGFFLAGPASFFIVVPIILAVTWAISFFLRKWNRSGAVKNSPGA